MASLDCALSGPDDGPPLVLGSSLGTTRAMWEPQIATLAKRRRVVAFDHRGHGGSEVPPGPYTIAGLGRDVLALLDRLEIDRFAYAGLSLGGMVGMWLAATVPDRVERLALLCTSACLGPAEGWYERARLVRSGGLPRVADAVVARWFTPSFTATQPDVVARYRAMLLALPPEGYASCCEAIATMDLRDMLSAVTSPTLVIAGGCDEATPVSHVEDIVARIESARLSVVPGAAHIANVEQPAVVTALLIKHLEGD
jgi:3-oxoadipate enol-lactonase